MHRRKYPPGFEQTILDLIERNNGRLRVEFGDDSTGEFLRLLELMADDGMIEVEDDSGQGQTFRLPRESGQSLAA